MAMPVAVLTVMTRVRASVTSLVLPESFSQLAAMQSLELDQSQLTTLPESFGKLATLQTLQDVGFGRIRRSPDGARASSSDHTLYIACAEAFVAGSWAWIQLILLRSCSLVQEIAARYSPL